MRRRICKTCGMEFQGEGQQRLCPDCRKKARSESTLRNRECQACGRTFLGYPRSRYCPECSVERRRERDRRAKRDGSARKLGSIDYCQVCGNEYVVQSGLQMYCPDCKDEAVRTKVLPAKRERAAEHRAEITARKKELNKNSAICAYCGKAFTPLTAAITCSEECAREYRRITRGIADYARGRRKTAPTHERYSSGLPQSELTGVSYLRARGKWQVTHQGKYIGLFATQAEAEAKKLELMQHEEPPN